MGDEVVGLVQSVLSKSIDTIQSGPYHLTEGQIDRLRRICTL